MSNSKVSQRSAAVLVLIGCVGVACSSSSPPVSNNGLDGAVADSAVVDSAVADSAVVDSAVADSAVVDSAVVDSAVKPDAGDSATTGCYPDGSYLWGTWTCGPPGGATKDIKAFAMSLLIQSVEQVVAGSSGSVVITYPAGCIRTVPLSITCPSAGMVTTTAGGARTCTASCPSNQCEPGTEPPQNDTYALAVSGNTYTSTRVLDAAFFAKVSLQQVAGCQIGDIETATNIKQ